MGKRKAELSKQLYELRAELDQEKERRQSESGIIEKLKRFFKG